MDNPPRASEGGQARPQQWTPGLQVTALHTARSTEIPAPKKKKKEEAGRLASLGKSKHPTETLYKHVTESEGEHSSISTGLCADSSNFVKCV